MIAFFTSLAHAQQKRVEVYQDVQVCKEHANAVGAGVGVAAGYVAGRLLFGKKGLGKYAGAAAGGVAGSQVGKEKTCQLEKRLVGYRVYTVQGDQIVETYEPVPQ